MLDAYDQVSAQNTGKVLLDFAQVEYINSTGIALIVRLFSQALKARQPSAPPYDSADWSVTSEIVPSSGLGGSIDLDDRLCGAIALLQLPETVERDLFRSIFQMISPSRRMTLPGSLVIRLYHRHLPGNGDQAWGFYLVSGYEDQCLHPARANRWMVLVYLFPEEYSTMR